MCNFNERTWWRLFQTRVVYTKLYICVFIALMASLIDINKHLNINYLPKEVVLIVVAFFPNISDLSRFLRSCLGSLVHCTQTLLSYLAFQYFDIARTWWSLFQKRVVRTKFDIYVFINHYIEMTMAPFTNIIVYAFILDVISQITYFSYS